MFIGIHVSFKRYFTRLGSTPYMHAVVVIFILTTINWDVVSLKNAHAIFSVSLLLSICLFFSYFFAIEYLFVFLLFLCYWVSVCFSLVSLLLSIFFLSCFFAIEYLFVFLCFFAIEYVFVFLWFLCYWVCVCLSLVSLLLSICLFFFVSLLLSSLCKAYQSVE